MPDDIRFMKGQFLAWIGNIMRDADAQGDPIDVESVVVALEEVAEELANRPTDQDFNDFLADLNDGRGTE